MKKLLSILLAVTMLLAMGSGLVLFTSSATEYVKMPMPGFNQYTPEQMGKMAKRVGYSGAEDYEYGSNWVFTKDDDGHTIISVDIPATGDNYNGYKVAFATADKYDQWRQNKLIDGLSPFGDVDMSNKLGFKFKIVNVGDVAFTGNIGFCFGSSTKRVAVDFRAADKEGDYYVVRFAKTGWYGYTTVGASWYYDCPTLEDTYYGVIDQFQIYFENDASMAGKRLSFYFDDFHAYGSVDSTELGKAIVAAKAADLDDTLIASAEEIYKAAEDHTQAEIDKAAKKLTDTIDEIKYGYEKYKDELDNLLTVADDLGFFDSTYENYEAISDADMVFANAASTLDELMNNVRIVRGCIAEEVMDGDLLTAFIKCNNAWKYNYTDASFKALTTAIDEVSAEFIYGGLSKGVALGENDAAALLNTAYQGLVALPVRANTANFFAGWTTTKVNDVVDANSGRLCDSIGDGKNTKDIWNNGDFSNNTLFEADDNFVMTALADFTGKSMGWKNMDRSKTLQPNDNGAFPPIDVTGLNDSYGIRFKLEVEGGSVERLLIGLSNCSDMMKEDYARYISPDCVDAEGYINIPFSYFETAWWTAEKGKFNSDDREKIIVLIIEAYGVEEDTVITMSDFTGYQLLEKATQEDVAKLEDRDIESTAAKVIDGNLHILVLLVETVGKGCRGRLVDDTLDIKTGNLTGFLGSLALRIREVCRHGDDRLGHVLTEIFLGRLLHLLKNHRADLLRRIHLAGNLDARGVVLATDDLVRHPADLGRNLVVGLAHKALDGEDGVVRIGDGLALGRVADLPLSAFGECDDRRSGPLAFVVDDDGRLVAFHHSHARVGGSKINSNNFTHNIKLLFLIIQRFAAKSDAPQISNPVPSSFYAKLSVYLQGKTDRDGLQDTFRRRKG